MTYCKVTTFLELLGLLMQLCYLLLTGLHEALAPNLLWSDSFDGQA